MFSYEKLDKEFGEGFRIKNNDLKKNNGMQDEKVKTIEKEKAKIKTKAINKQNKKDKDED